MAFAISKVIAQRITSKEKGEKDHSERMRKLETKRRKALAL